MKGVLFAMVFVACGGVAPPPSQHADIDTDGDGIVDSADACPEAPETVNGYRDDDGCPDSSTRHDPFPTELAHQWSGTMTLNIAGSSVSSPHVMTLTMAEDGMSAMLTGVCPDGSGSVSLVWLDGAAWWSGAMLCKAATWAGCKAIDATVYRIRGIGVGSSSVDITLEGTARSGPSPSAPTACNASGEMTLVFDGARQ
jgi:hypothetical protein